MRLQRAIPASRVLALAGAAALLVAGCGGAPPRQDANEPEGDFPVEVVRAEFPEEQKLASDSRLEIEVRNTGEETIPNLNVTVEGFDKLLRNPLDASETDPDVADPERPVFVVEQSPIEFERNRFPANQSLVDREINPPYGRQTAYVNTYSLGPLEPRKTATFRWDLAAVDPGPFEIEWRINAGLDGKAIAVTDGGGAPRGTFSGEIDDEAPTARVADGDGETILTQDGRRIDDHRGVIRDE